MNSEEAKATVKIEANSQTHKTTSRLRNVGGYLLNKLTKSQKSEPNQKKRKNFFSIFEKEPKSAVVVNTQKSCTLTEEPTDLFIENNDLLNSTPIKSLDNSMAKSKIQAAGKRKYNPRKFQSIPESENMKDETTLENSNLTDIKYFKSNDSVNELIEKTKQNFQNIRLSSSDSNSSLFCKAEKTNIVENLVKISNEMNLDQEKTLSCESQYIKKSTSYNSEFVETNTNDNSSFSRLNDENNIHIYDNSTSLAFHNYSNTSTLSDSSIDSPPINKSKKVRLLSQMQSNESQIIEEDSKTSKVVELRSKFNNETKSSKSYDGLDKIYSFRQESLHKPDVKNLPDETNSTKNFLTYSKSLKLNQIDTPEPLLSNKTGARVALIINDLSGSTGPVWRNDANKKNRNTNSVTSSSPSKESSNDSMVKVLEKGKVKSIIKDLEK